MLRFKKTEQGELKNRPRIKNEPLKIVGEPEDAVPYCWRHPLDASLMKKVSKLLKTLAAEEQSRMLALRNEDK